MNLEHLHLRRSFAGALTALMLLLSVSLPVLEQADFGHEPVVESEHSPTDCPQAHDHTICTQVGANQAAPTSSDEQSLEQRIVQVVSATSQVLAKGSAVAEGHPSRAPPRV